MGLFDWLRRREAGEESPTLTFEEKEKSFEGLDIKGALDAHAKWRERLEEHIAGRSEEVLEVGAVSCDDNCALGKWIYSAGHKKYGHLKELEDLRATHADFHLSAGEVLIRHGSGNREQALDHLNTEFKKLSGRVQLSLVRLYSKASRA